MISDNGPQYSSEKFREFAAKYNFQHITSSPGNSQSNGAAEAAVKTIKRMMKKCHETNEDPYLGLLNQRNTPTEGMQTSPSQRLFGRRTQTLIPATSVSLKPNQYKDEQANLEIKQQKAALKYVNRRTLKPLHPGDNVFVQPIQPGQKTAQQATVTRHLGGRSYEVSTNKGKLLRRNRDYFVLLLLIWIIPPTVQLRIQKPLAPHQLRHLKSNQTKTLDLLSPHHNRQFQCQNLIFRKTFLIARNLIPK